MDGQTYTRRREEIRTYFDRTAIDAWKRFATEAPLGRIRASVREGRNRMRAEMLSMLPDDLAGWRVLDAGCGSGSMSVELARRGADVVAVDLAPEIVRFARETLPEEPMRGTIAFSAGDMLSPRLGRFDAVVAMDSLIHYAMPDAVSAVARLAERTDRRIVFTFAPRTPLLAAMHGVGRLFPKSDRAPSIQPVEPSTLVGALGTVLGSAWACGRTVRVAHGFYTSQTLQVIRS